MNEKWIVHWENGKTITFVPYDSLGMTSFIRKGLELGVVTVNGKEVEIDQEGFWRYRENIGE